MHNKLAYQLSQYYQPQQVPSMAWIALVTWYKGHKLAHTKILQNFWLYLVHRTKTAIICTPKIKEDLLQVANQYIHKLVTVIICV